MACPIEVSKEYASVSLNVNAKLSKLSFTALEFCENLSIPHELLEPPFAVIN